MDRAGFDLIDTEYQRCLEEKRQELQVKYNLEYSNKQFSGNEELDKDDRAKERARFDKAFQQELTAFEAQLDSQLFPDRGRKTELEILETKERRKEMVNNRFRDNDRGR